MRAFEYSVSTESSFGAMLYTYIYIEETLSDVHHRAHPTNQLTKARPNSTQQRQHISNTESVILVLLHNLLALCR